MGKRSIASIVALIITAIFLLFALKHSVFNMLPYLIHEYIWKGGSGESIFVRVFDIVWASVLFMIIYKFMNRLLKIKLKDSLR